MIVLRNVGDQIFISNGSSLSSEKKIEGLVESSPIDFLKDYWFNHVTFEEFPVVGTRLSLDFYNANKRVAVEVQGSQHTKYNKFFHGGHKSNYLEQLKRDQIKAEFCEVNDIILVEIYDSDIINKSLFKKFDVTL